MNSVNKNKPRPFGGSLKERGKPIFWVGLFFVTLVSGWGSFWLWQELYTAKPLLEPAIIESKAANLKIRRSIDGLWTEAAAATSSVFGAMIDNESLARPPVGLSQAALVWEAPIEGGATRWLVIWPVASAPDKIGPIRSARPYFLDWIKEVNGLYLHVGGSPQALDDLKTKGIANLNEYYRGWYFWREADRPRPHNVFTSGELVKRALADYPRLAQAVSDSLVSWPYQEEVKVLERDLVEPSPIVFGLVQVSWRYDRERNIYERWQNEAQQLEASGAVLSSKNVIYFYTDIKIIDQIGRLEVRTLGSGRVVVARDGRLIEGRWRKDSPESRTQFFDEQGLEIHLNAGPTWIEVLRTSNQ